MLVDSHCHLDRLDLTPYHNDLAAALAAAADKGVERVLCVGIDLSNAQRVIDIARDHAGVYASVGVHPNDINAALDIDALERLAGQPEVVAIGETGLDYYYSREQAVAQRESFVRHMQLATKLGKPVIVHTRAAQQDTIELMREYADREHVGVMHCFTEDWTMAKQALDLGFYISFSGIVSFRNAEDLREVVRQVPLDRLLVETDAPYLAPVPYRGKKNEPKYLYDVASCVAQIKGMELEALAAQTTANFSRLFAVPIA